MFGLPLLTGGRLQPLLWSGTRPGPPSPRTLPKHRADGITLAERRRRILLLLLLSWFSPGPAPLGRPQRLRNQTRLGRMIRRSFLGGRGRGRRARRCWKTSSILLCRLSFSSSSLCPALSLLYRNSPSEAPPLHSGSSQSSTGGAQSRRRHPPTTTTTPSPPPPPFVCFTELSGDHTTQKSRIQR